MAGYRHCYAWAAVVFIVALMFLELPPMFARQDTVVQTYGSVVEVDALIKRQYVEPVSDTRLVTGALRGMLYELDPYSRYFAPHEWRAFQRRSDGNYVGIGLELGWRDDQLIVIAPLAGSPAARAGIQPGDVVLAVDEQDVEHLSVLDVEDKLVGEPGTEVSLTLQRGDDDTPFTVRVARAEVRLPSVHGHHRDSAGRWCYRLRATPSVGYIRISSFRATTGAEFRAALEALAAQPPAGLILDLRCNPGGLLEQGVAVVDCFVDSGDIVSTVTRRHAVRIHSAHADGTIRRLPLVVLVNEHSASAAEIVSGSLQDHGRAVLIGHRTFGKGSVQRLINLTAQSAAIKITAAYYQLPGGRVIHRTPRNADTDAWGVMPDMVVELPAEELARLRQTWSRLEQADPTVVPPPGTDAPTEAWPPLDRQLQAAVDQLLNGGVVHPG